MSVCGSLMTMCRNSKQDSVVACVASEPPAQLALHSADHALFRHTLLRNLQSSDGHCVRSNYAAPLQHGVQAALGGKVGKKGRPVVAYAVALAAALSVESPFIHVDAITVCHLGCSAQHKITRIHCLRSLKS